MNLITEQERVIMRTAVDQKKFNTLLRTIQRYILPQFHVPSIRKVLKFEDPTLREFQYLNPPGEDVDISRLVFTTDFMIDFFPAFRDEYWGNNLKLLLAQYPSDAKDGMVVLDNSQYHALVLASFQISQKAQVAYNQHQRRFTNLTSGLMVEPVFKLALPKQEDVNPLVFLDLTIGVFL